MPSGIRGILANAPAFSNFVTRVAAGLLGTWPARRLLESPSWGVTETPPAVRLLDVDVREISLPACPFDVAPTSDGQCLFVSLQQPNGTQRTPGSIAVLHRNGDTFRVTHQIPLTAAAWGLALLRDESLLAVANSHGVALLNARAARDRSKDTVLSRAHYGRDLQTIRVLGSAEGRWLAASDEHNRTVTILDLESLAAGVTGAEAVLSQVPVDLAPLGLAVSENRRYVYATCEMRRVRAPDLVNWFVWGGTLQGTLRRAGFLCTIDLETAVEDPTQAVVSRAIAGGHPVRIARSSDPPVAWVTARASNQLIAFSIENPESPKRVAAVAVGPAPVGLALLEELGIVLVANSGRFGAPGQPETVALIDIDRALAGVRATLGHVSVGSFPREIVVDDRQGVVYVTNFYSRSLSVLTIESLRRAVESRRARSLTS